MSCPLNADLEISDLEIHHNSFPQPSPHWCHITHWDQHISGRFCLSASLLNHHFYRVVPTCYKYICWSQWGLSSHLPASLPLDLPNLHQFTSVYLGLSENRVYSQWNSHLIGIMISKTIGFRGLAYFQTHPSRLFGATLKFLPANLPRRRESKLPRLDWRAFRSLALALDLLILRAEMVGMCFQ